MSIAAAMLMSLLASSQGGLHARFDAAQEGELPAVVVDRPAVALQRDGSIVPPNEPRWGRPHATADTLGGWTRVWGESSNVTVLLSGYDSDDSTPMLAVINGNQMVVNVFVGARLASGPELTKSMWRYEDGIGVVDLLAGTLAQRPDHAYRPRAGTVLPGCVLFLCQRSVRVDDPVDGEQWLAEGVSVVALDHARGQWSWRLVGDVAPIGGDDSQRGRTRVCPSSMTNYFPATDGVVDGRLVDAWIPFVDYLVHTPEPASAGQCMLLRARRSEVGTTRWSFEGPALLHEFNGGTKRHSHAAGWTPNGVLLSIGDGIDSEVALLVHDGPGVWTDPTQWTMHHDVHGAPLADGDGGDVGANQFWSVAPGDEPNTLICGGDNVSGAILRTTIPEDPAQGVRFERLWGVQPADIGDAGNAQCTCSLMHRLKPESAGPLLARFYLESPMSQVYEGRLLVSEDSRNFATTAGLRISGSKLAPMALFGGSMLTTPLGSAVDYGLYQMPLPSVSVHRPLCIGPASVNALYRDDLIGTLEIGADGGATVSEIARGGADDLAELAASAPGIGPVWHIQRDMPGEADLATIVLPAPEAGWQEGSMWAQLWIANLTAGMLRPQAHFDLGPIEPRHRVAVASERQWVPFDLITDLDDPTAGAFPTLDLSLPASGPSPPTDFLITLDSLTVGAAPPWPSPESIADRPAERVSLDLPTTAPPWTLELDLAVPEMGVDRGLGDRFSRPPLVSLALEDGSHLQVVADLLYSRFELVLRAAGGEETVLVTNYGLRPARLDTVRLRISAGTGGVGLDCVSGGRRTEPARMQGTHYAMLPALQSVTFGAVDGTLDMPIEVLRVSLWPGESDIDLGIMPESGDIWCDADLDLDGFVGGSDILLLLNAWGACPEPDGDDPVDCPEDLTGDGIVDVSDLLSLLTDLGPCQS